MKWTFPILFVCTFYTKKVVGGQEGYPKISIGGWMENDFHSEWIHNESVPLGTSPFPFSIVVPSSVKGLSLVCNASYPIEWKFHRERWGGRHRLQFALQSTRISDGIDVKSFSSELSFFSFASSVSGNYTCQKVGSPRYSSSMYVFWEGSSPPYLTLAGSYRRTPQIYFEKDSKSFVLPCMVSLPTVTPSLTKLVAENEVEIKTNSSVQYDPRVGFTMTDLVSPYGKYTCQVGDAEDDGDGDIITFNVTSGSNGNTAEFNETIRHGASYLINSTSKEITCCSMGPKPPKLKMVSCDHPTICALGKHTLHTMESSKKRDGVCSIVSLHALRSGVFRCLGTGIDIVREFFYPMPEDPTPPWLRGGKAGNNNTKVARSNTSAVPPPDPYYNWNDADPLKMMLVTKLRSPVYIGQNRSFYCRVSPFYYAQGIVWGVSFTNQSMEFYDGRDGKEPNPYLTGGRGRHFSIIFGRNQAYLDLTIVEHLDTVTCYAPVWNSTDWGKKSISMEVKRPTSPSLKGKLHEQVSWYLTDKNKKLECQFDGEPMPSVLWKKDNKTFALNTFTQNGTSTVTLPVVNADSEGEYECIIDNGAGSLTKRFHISVSHGNSSTISAILILSLLGFVVVSTILVFMFRRVRSQKNTMSHLANLAFKDVTGADATPNNRSHVPVDTNRIVTSISATAPPQQTHTANGGNYNMAYEKASGASDNFPFPNPPPPFNVVYEDIPHLDNNDNTDEGGIVSPKSPAFTTYQKF